MCLVRTKGYRYRDFAVVTGDVPQYANYVPETFAQYGIPFFIDQTRNILFHPFIEFIRAALESWSLISPTRVCSAFFGAVWRTASDGERDGADGR